MTHEKTDGMIRHTRLPNESKAYLQKREELRLAEVELIRHSERVAALPRRYAATRSACRYAAACRIVAAKRV